MRRRVLVAHLGWSPRVLVAVSFAMAAVVLTATSAHAQASMFSGEVRALNDSSPIVSAEVRSGGRTTRTDAAGRFAIAAEPGDTVWLSAMGFRQTRLIAGRATSATYLEPVPTVLAASVTTVSNRSIRAAESPASVAVIDERQLMASGVSAAGQVLRNVPGLTEVPTPPSRSTIAIRGLDGPRVLVLVDGEPVPGALMDNRDIGRLSTLAAERIEVVKGPSSVEFGSDALGGVINLVTAPPPEHWALDGTARTGSLGRREANVGVAGSAGPLGMRVTGGWRQLNGLTAVDAGGSNLDRVYDVRADVRLFDTSATAVRAIVNATRERQRWPVGAGYNGFVDDLGMTATLEGRQRTSLGTFLLRATAMQYSYEFRQALGDAPVAGTGSELEQRERVARGRLSWSRVIGRQTWDAGVQLSARRMIAPQKVEGDTADDRVTEAFVRDSWTVRNWVLVAGMRFTSSSAWGDAATPMAGVVWQMSPSFRGRVSYATGFRAPSFKEVRYTFANASAGYTVLGNPNLQPERSANASGGVTWNVRGITVDAEVYRNELSDLIDTRFDGIDKSGLQVYRNVNVARARIQGTELSLGGTVAGTEVTVGWNYLDARNLDSSTVLDGRAAHSGRLRLGRSWLAKRSLSTDASVSYTGPTTLGTATRESFASFDGQVRWRATNQVELSLGADNILDQRATLWPSTYQRRLYGGIRLIVSP